MTANGREEILICGFVLWLVLALSAVSDYIKPYPLILEMDIAKDIVKVAERS